MQGFLSAIAPLGHTMLLQHCSVLVPSQIAAADYGDVIGQVFEPIGPAPYIP